MKPSGFIWEREYEMKKSAVFISSDTAGLLAQHFKYIRVRKDCQLCNTIFCETHYFDVLDSYILRIAKRPSKCYIISTERVIPDVQIDEPLNV